MKVELAELNSSIENYVLLWHNKKTEKTFQSNTVSRTKYYSLDMNIESKMKNILRNIDYFRKKMKKYIAAWLEKLGNVLNIWKTFFKLQLF